MTTNTADAVRVDASQPHPTLGYKSFQLGGFSFRRDEYFVHIGWTTRDGRPMSHTMDAGSYLRARCATWPGASSTAGSISTT